MPTEKELPRYKCHKEVHALKIAGITPFKDGAMITPADETYLAFQVEKAYMEKHQPQEGGYFIVYEDGYTSFSPALAFENGYTLVEG